MEWLVTALSAQAVAEFEGLAETWGAAAFLLLFAAEMLRLALRRRASRELVGDAFASFVTFGLFLVLTYGLIAAAYISIFYWVYLNFAVTEIAVTPLSVAALIVLCDLAYYWEHRFSHRVGMAWATHSVHHSSPHFNISVAYRFGPMDGVWPLLFHLPLVFAGFDPIVIFACEAFVQLYQTVLHTELVGKLPRPVEAVFNTPSHHRVHHGANEAYLDKNYGGIFILWDRLFGTFAEERESVHYGLTQPIKSNNPLIVWFHGFVRLLRRSKASTSETDAIYSWIAPPEWRPGDPRTAPQGAVVPVLMLLLLLFWAGSSPGLAGEAGEARGHTPGESRPSTVPGAEDGSHEGQQLRELVLRYYEQYARNEMDRAYEVFAEDALFHYRMDFGAYYGRSEFSFRANDVGANQAAELEGYEALAVSYHIESIRLQGSVGIASVKLTETYDWDGYAGKMKAEERL
ncbi:MAG: sterol desaturase family protein, partial [Pseudomonadota bacterium]